MGKRLNSKLGRYLGGSILFFSVQGCAFLSGKADAPPLPPDLVGTTQSIPLPVEVAQDISVLARGGIIAPVNPPLPQKPAENRVPNQIAPEVAHVEKATADCKCPDRRSASLTSPRIFKTPDRSVRRKMIKGSEDYLVKKDDTLMKISFEKFGNVYRWREIYNENKERIPDYNQLVEGTVLKVKGVEYVVIERNGLPYLIRRNDTLVKISRGIYGTPKRWLHLWENNRQLIHDPNKIYAGFTLYYQPDGITKSKAGQLTLKGPLRDRLPAAKK